LGSPPETVDLLDEIGARGAVRKEVADRRQKDVG
jgi:hypothetical protein